MIKLPIDKTILSHLYPHENIVSLTKNRKIEGFYLKSDREVWTSQGNYYWWKHKIDGKTSFFLILLGYSRTSIKFQNVN